MRERTPRNVKLSDLIKFTKAVGFVEKKRTGGSHNYIFVLPGYTPAEMMNYQKPKGKKNMAKDYQVKQFLGVLDKYPELEKNLKK